MRVGNTTTWRAILAIMLLWGSLTSQAWAERKETSGPPVHAAAAIVINRDTGATLWAKNPDKRLPPASTTKIVTGLLLARDLPPEQSITASPNAAQMPGHALGMRPGETFHARDLLHAVLLASANDASAAAAEQMAGTEAAFAARMNAWAAANNAPNTHFANASGLPAPQHYSTARDLASLARAALQNPIFAQTVRTRAYVLPRSGGRLATPLTNENTLLWTVPGMEGVKAGWTQEAGGCFVGAASRQGQRIITVVLNSPDWQRETAALVEYGFARLKQATPAITPPDTVSPSFSTDIGKHDKAREGSSYAGAASPTSVGVYTGAVNESSSAANEGGGVSPSAASHGTPEASGTGAPASVAFAGRSGRGQGQPRSAPAYTGRQGETSAPVPDGHSGLTPSLSSLSASLPDLHLPAGAGRAPTNVAAVSRNAAASRSAQTPASQSGTISTSDPAARTSKLSFALLLALLAVTLLILWKGHSLMSDFLAGLFGKRRREEPSPSPEYVPSAGFAAAIVPMPVKPQFTFKASLLDRLDGRAWLQGILETPARLLEPAVRRQAVAIRDADPLACQSGISSLLNAPGARTRAVGAELTGTHAPRLAEETLLALLKDEHTGTEVRAEAVQQLSDLGGDRHERLWLQMLLRDGSAPAAHALARQPLLEEATCKALQHVLTPGNDPREMDGELKRNLRDAHIAAVLLAQGKLSRLEAAPYFNALSPNYGEPILVSTLRGSREPQAAECLVDLVIHGHAYPALQSLLEADPRHIRAALEPLLPKLDKAQQSRALILKWLTLGEGNGETVQELALAGNDLARGAIQLSRLHRWEPSVASPDALLAASQIYSLRLGFSRHAQEDIALAFRKAATDGEAQSLAALPPDLQPLARAYAHPEVYEAVQSAMHAEDGLPVLLAALARHPENPQYRQELAFWCDKMPSASRLAILHALCADGGTDKAEIAATRAIIAERARDPDAQIRSAALRWLRAHPETEAKEQELSIDYADYTEKTDPRAQRAA